jgi:radical SAM protein with 4Fe4S-binding SPASM domain
MLVLVPQYFGSTVFDRTTSKYLPFDQEASALLIRLKSEPFDNCLNGTTDERRTQLIRFFEHFYRLGFFTIDGRFAGSVMAIRPPDDHLLGPLAVHLEVVSACNLTCTHCFAGKLPRKERALKMEELDDLFKTLALMGSFRLGLTGGEPLLRRDIFDIIDLAIHHGLHPCITTNGLLLTENIAREFGKRELVWLNVSLEGACAKTNDLIRGKGTFERVLRHLSMLSKHSRFTLAFTIMRSNLYEVEECAKLAYRVGAHTAVFRPLYPVGTASKHLELMPTYAEYNEALNLLAAQQYENNFEMCSIDPFSPQSRVEAQAVTHENYGCGAGNHVCSISVSGDVNPCSFLGPGFVAANIRTLPFDSIWHTSQVFREFRSPSEPGSSDKGEVFHGGCRARALIYAGSIHAPDPWITQHSVRLQSQSLETNRPSSHHPMSILELSNYPKV